MRAYRNSVVTALSLLTLLLTTSSLAGQEADLADVLKAMPQPWQSKVHRITPDEYAETVRYWAEQHPEVLTVEELGKGGEELPIFLLRISDPKVPDADKQVCLITALHGGPERTGTTTILHLVEWLLGDSSEAAEIRRRQVILLMPIVNPHAFFVTDRFGNAAGIDPYTGGGPQNWDMPPLTFKEPDKAPEIAAFLPTCFSIGSGGIQASMPGRSRRSSMPGRRFNWRLPSGRPGRTASG